MHSTDKKSKLPRSAANYVVLPLYAALPADQQMSVFEPSGDLNTRKIILSTNIAETSVTIDGIRYVVDCGLVKVRQYQPSNGMDCLVVVPIARSEAWQRSGRAGRQQPGVCYRLYPESAFLELRSQIVPEILRSNLSLVILQLKSVNVHDVMGFEWMSKPPKAAIVRALVCRQLINAFNSHLDSFFHLLSTFLGELVGATLRIRCIRFEWSSDATRHSNGEFPTVSYVQSCTVNEWYIRVRMYGGDVNDCIDVKCRYGMGDTSSIRCCRR
jgi:hypothetical protein